MKIEIDAYDFQKMFKRMDRDYYSSEAYQILFDFYNEYDEDYEPDIIGICGEWTEYTTEDLISHYGGLYEFDEYIQDNFESLEEALSDGNTIEELEKNHFDDFIANLEYNTMVYHLDNGNYLVMSY